jgi:hypothetical protein
MVRRHVLSFGFGQGERAIRCRTPAGRKAALDRTLIDPHGFDFKLEASITEQPLSRRTRRGED